MDKIDIAVAGSCEAKTWKNQSFTWEKLKGLLLKTHRTHETVKEYKRADKEQKLRIKDVGGYVGGYLINGQRKASTVLHRGLITLDVDYPENAVVGFWETLQVQCKGREAVVHSTHSHTPDNPRYRLIMPLSREVSRDEYEAIARYLAGSIGIDCFDNTTFQPQRLMFWPSTPKDGEHYAKHQEGEFINADEILSNYTDWRDSTAWPTSSTVIEGITREKKNQENPLEKSGIVGAFCKSYSISEAIQAFLPDEYAGAGEGRYTYARGSAVGGVVVYDDIFAYSHHSTDPATGHLCNAFDLVRMHKFEGDSYDASYKKMIALCLENKLVKKQMAADRMAAAAYDFGISDEILLEKKKDDMGSDEWLSELVMDKSGKYLSTAGNISAILANDPHLKGLMRYNAFDYRIYIGTGAPWRKVKKSEPWRNVDDSGLRNYLETVYGISAPSKIEDAFILEAEKHFYHPVREYLNSLTWDGVPRVDTLLIDYFGAEDTIYNRMTIRTTLVGAVARAYVPGIKFDLMMVLVETSQGSGKGTFLQKMGGEWFNDSFDSLQGNKPFEQIQGSWIIEVAELSAFNKTSRESVKHFMTKREDKYRSPYKKVTETVKRGCIFIGTSNNKNFLDDPSGNRRFLPVDVRPEHIKKSSLSPENLKPDEVGQIWAEAVTLYQGGQKLYFDQELEALAQEEQQAHSITDERVGLIDEYLKVLLPENWDGLDLYSRRKYMQEGDKYGTEERCEVCSLEIWYECLGQEIKDLSRAKTKEINDILRGFKGWHQAKKVKTFGAYGRQRYYIKEDNA